LRELRATLQRHRQALLIVAGTAALALLVLATGPETRREHSSPPAPVVSVMPVDPAPFQRVAEGFGTVVPSREVHVVPEVEGSVLAIHPQLEPGGILREGDVLLRIDAAEYRAAVAGAEAALAEARAAFDIERGRQTVAKREWELFGDEIPDAQLGRELALREPQLRQAEARIASARSALESARLDLARTEIRAPFDALVVDESIEVGQRVSRTAPVAELVGVESFWVRASLPLARLPAVLEMSGAEATTRVELAPGLGGEVVRAGRLVRSLGRVDPEGRMAQVLIAIEDPLGLLGGPAIPLGSYVRVEIEAGALEGVVRIPRHGVRENEELWVADGEDRFQVRRADVLWRQGEELAIRDVFSPDDRLILSALISPLPGMALRPRLAEEAPPPAPSPSTSQGIAGDGG
jgi:RND family efflux transporter MFP subunit